ncbi:hypothetical protein RESH_05294 [Rhodopirellula europaea SH398]|uniref:Uncharacterized protein n=1 Tax=Rhodopirellula europaea SH398 TaxID=1263868 RepID=M5RXK1_9BACT|nr:hypothetical protein RESH_05294 [Rhodopirellula europaea SH398]
MWQSNPDFRIETVSVLRRRPNLSGGFAAILIAHSGPDEPPTEINVSFHSFANANIVGSCHGIGNRR